MKNKLVATLLSVAVTIGAVACGGGSEPSSEGKPRSGTDVPDGVRAQYATIEEEVGAAGGEKRAGPWRIAYIVEPAEGWFERSGEDFKWRPPARGETHHIEILPIEAETGRLVPNVPITLEVESGQGERVTRKRLSPYYAEFFHYADNFEIPRAGSYTLKVTIGAPDLRRHGEEQDPPPLAEGAEVELQDVRLEPEEGA